MPSSTAEALAAKFGGTPQHWMTGKELDAEWHTCTTPTCCPTSPIDHRVPFSPMFASRQSLRHVYAIERQEKARVVATLLKPKDGRAISATVYDCVRGHNITVLLRLRPSRDLPFDMTSEHL